MATNSVLSSLSNMVSGIKPLTLPNLATSNSTPITSMGASPVKVPSSTTTPAPLSWSQTVKTPAPAGMTALPKTSTTSPSSAPTMAQIQAQAGLTPQQASQTAGVSVNGYISPTGQVNLPSNTSNQPTLTYTPPSAQSTSQQNQTTFNPATGRTTNNQTGAPVLDTSNQGALQQLLSLQQRIDPRIQQTATQIKGLQMDLANSLGANANNPIPLEFQTGRAGAMAQVEAAKEKALQEQLQSEMQGMGLSGGMLQNLIGATQPQMQFGQLTNPQTGMPVSGGSYGSNPQLQSAVQQAAQLVRNGANPNDPQVQSLLSTFGMPGQQAFTQAMQQMSGGTYNPTAQSAIAQQNISQGQQYQGQAVQLATTLQQFDTIAPQVTKFLSDTGINNSTSPWVNKTIKDYISKNLSADNAQTIGAMFADLKTYTAQILGNSGLNPTEVSDTVNSFDPSLLSPAQLQNFITNIRNLGQTRLAPLQQTATASYGGQSGYMGTPANTSNNYAYGVPNTATQTGIGSAVGILPSLIGSVSGFASKLFGNP